MKVYKEIDICDFEFWSGAKSTRELLTYAELEYIQENLEESYPQGISETLLNDIFWFETDWIAEMIGYTDFEDLYQDRKK